MGAAGSVAWMFHKKGSIVVPKSAGSEDKIMEIILEAGGEDLRDDGDNFEVITDPNAFEPVKEALEKAGIKAEHAEVGMLPQNYVKLEGQAANTMVRLLEALEDHDDVQHVWSNGDIDAKTLEEVAS
jgi:transcriptional/translational regulatory protein YebC/TACO1